MFFSKGILLFIGMKMCSTIYDLGEYKIGLFMFYIFRSLIADVIPYMLYLKRIDLIASWAAINII